MFARNLGTQDQSLWDDRGGAPPCSRRGRYTRYISVGRNIAFASKVERHPGRSHR